VVSYDSRYYSVWCSLVTADTLVCSVWCSVLTADTDWNWTRSHPHPYTHTHTYTYTDSVINHQDIMTLLRAQIEPLMSR
jgi:hypothetical protein